MCSMSERKFNNKEVSAILREVSVLLELKGENPFKVRAYSNAARSINLLEEEIVLLAKEKGLNKIQGIGEALASQITELVETGRLQLLEDLKSTIPSGHLDLLKIPGLGPKKIRILYDSLNIQTIGELEYACLENRLIELEGFGQKTQGKILQGIQQVKKYQGRFLYGEVISQAEEILAKISSHPKVNRASLAGSLRRKMEVVRNINLVVSSSSPQEILTAFSKFPEVEVVQFKDNSNARYSLTSGVKIHLQIASDRSFPFSLYQLTGNLDHWNGMVKKASAMGLELTDQGLRRNIKTVSCKEEEGIFDALGLDVIPPELREGQDEIDAAESKTLPRLVEGKDIRGIFHVHSAYSDGTKSIKTMAEAAKKMGFSYMGLSDHSQSAGYAGGLTPEKLKKQWDEVNRLNEDDTGFTVFRGIESDILPDGSLDYDEATLKQFDFVIASVHSHFSLPLEEMTQRVIKAIRNPYTTMVAHPTGRLLLAREPYAIEMTRIIDEAAKTGVAIELNAHPYRLDIDWRLCKYAKGKGVKIAINPDAHDEEGLKHTAFGIGIARKGWLEPNDILNTLDLGQMKTFLQERRSWTRKPTPKE
jgi:DNA polymerase (family 10)